MYHSETTWYSTDGSYNQRSPFSVLKHHFGTRSRYCCLSSRHSAIGMIQKTSYNKPLSKVSNDPSEHHRVSRRHRISQSICSFIACQKKDIDPDRGGRGDRSAFYIGDKGGQYKMQTNGGCGGCKCPSLSVQTRLLPASHPPTSSPNLCPTPATPAACLLGQKSASTLPAPMIS